MLRICTYHRSQCVDDHGQDRPTLKGKYCALQPHDARGLPVYAYCQMGQIIDIDLLQTKLSYIGKLLPISWLTVFTWQRTEHVHGDAFICPSVKYDIVIVFNKSVNTPPTILCNWCDSTHSVGPWRLFPHTANFIKLTGYIVKTFRPIKMDYCIRTTWLFWYDEIYRAGVMDRWSQCHPMLNGPNNWYLQTAYETSESHWQIVVHTVTDIVYLPTNKTCSW